MIHSMIENEINNSFRNVLVLILDDFVLIFDDFVLIFDDFEKVTLLFVICVCHHVQIVRPSDVVMQKKT